MYDIEATWVHDPTGTCMGILFKLDCSEENKMDVADEAVSEWYYNSATEAAIAIYHEEEMEYDNIDLEDFIENFIANCVVDFYVSPSED